MLSPIGVFDSGVGGLTVAAALRQILPSEHILYIGDTARVPYGAKSPETIQRYGLELGHLLLKHHAKIIVVACNTASAIAVPKMRNILPVPIQGVIGPGAKAATKTTRNSKIGVIGTRATITSGAYEKRIHQLAPNARVFSTACPLLVPLIEEGLFDDPITEQMILRYLTPLLRQGIDTLVLGCTHYPLLAPAIQHLVGPDIRLVDSAKNCAAEVARLLKNKNLLAPSQPHQKGRLDVTLTDSSTSFLHLAREALSLEFDSFNIISPESHLEFATAK